MPFWVEMEAAQEVDRPVVAGVESASTRLRVLSSCLFLIRILFVTFRSPKTDQTQFTMKYLAALFLSMPFALGQPTDSSLGPSPGCYKGSAIGAKMIPVRSTCRHRPLNRRLTRLASAARNHPQMPAGYLKEAAAEQCFQYCSTLVPDTRVLANMFDKSNRRKSRVQCKCFDAEDAVNAVTLTCTDVAADDPSTAGRKANNWKDQMKDKVKNKIKRGKAKKCKKCTTVGPNVPVPAPVPAPEPTPAV